MFAFEGHRLSVRLSEIVYDRMVTRAQGMQEDSRVLERRTRSVSDMREHFSHRSRDLVIRPVGVLLAYECLFEATRGPVQIARGHPALARRHLSKSRDLRLSGLGSMVHPAEGIAYGRKLKRGHAGRATGPSPFADQARTEVSS
jgi:hypothetical protein